MPKMTLNRFRVDFIIADSGSQIRVPIDQSLAAVDPLLVEEIKKRPANRAATSLVQRKSCSLPIAAAAHRL